MKRPAAPPFSRKTIGLAAALVFSACVPIPPILVRKSSTAPPVAIKASSVGLLLLARGGSSGDDRALVTLKNETIRVAPADLASGLANPDAIQGAINRLVARNVRRILAVPLFAASQNELVMQTRFVLGLGPTLSADMINALKQEPRYRTTLFLAQANSPIPLSWGSPVDGTPVPSAILEHRALRLSRDPAAETLVVVGRGSGIDALDAASLAELNRLAQSLQSRLGFAGASAASLRFDAAPSARSQASASLRSIVARASSRGRAVVLLDSVCDDGMDRRVRSALKGLRYAFDPRPLNAAPALRRWVLALARRAEG
jgi:sirohydrochlorin ferrochelatase